MRQTVFAFCATLSARGMSALGGILLSLIVARIAGADGLGRFAIFLSLLGACAILARYGKDMLLLRAVAWSLDRKDDGTAVALLHLGVVRVVVPALALGGLGSILLASGALGMAFPGTVALMPLALLLLTVLSLAAGYAKGRSRAWLAPLFEIGGISMLTAILLAGIALIGVAIQEVLITIVFGTTLFFLLVFGAGVMIWRDTPRGLHLPVLDSDQRSELRTGQLDFTLIALATFLTQAGCFLLAAPFLSDGDIGLLRAAERIALLVSFPMLAINPVIMPHIVRLSGVGEVSGLRRMILRAMLASGGIAACIALPLLLWPERALTLMGAEFGAAALYLSIMALAQFASAVLGPLAVLLNMSGRERVSMWINVATLVLSSALIPGLSLAYGGIGFAVAYAAAILAKSTLITSAFIHGRVKPRKALKS